MTSQYEVNANDNRSYTSQSAKDVADVAVEWKKQGHEPHAFAILDGRGNYAIQTVRVEVTNKRETAANLAAAKGE